MSKNILEQLQDVLTESKIEPEKQKEILENFHNKALGAENAIQFIEGRL